MKKFASFLAVFLLITLCAAASESGDRDIPAEVAQLTDSLKKQFAPDKRVALLEIDYSFSGKNVMLRGVTTSAEAKTVLLKELAKKGTIMYMTAQKVGIPDPNYFGKLFKRNVGITYSAYLSGE